MPDINHPSFGYDVEEDCIFVLLIRCYQPGQYETVMKELIQIAKAEGKPILRGHVTGEARLRLFRMKGWRFVRKPYPNMEINIMEYDVKKEKI